MRRNAFTLNLVHVVHVIDIYLYIYMRLHFWNLFRGSGAGGCD